MTNDTKPEAAPERIWLQWHGDTEYPELETGEVSVADVTWEREQIFKHDIEYTRSDLARTPAEKCQWAACTDGSFKTGCGVYLIASRNTDGWKWCPFCGGKIE